MIHWNTIVLETETCSMATIFSVSNISSQIIDKFTSRDLKFKWFGTWYFNLYSDICILWSLNLYDLISRYLIIACCAIVMNDVLMGGNSSHSITSVRQSKSDSKMG